MVALLFGRYDRQVAARGFLRRPPQQSPAVVYIMVDSVAATIDAVVAHGARSCSRSARTTPEITARFPRSGRNVIGLYSNLPDARIGQLCLWLSEADSKGVQQELQKVNQKPCKRVTGDGTPARSCAGSRGFALYACAFDLSAIRARIQALHLRRRSPRGSR